MGKRFPFVSNATMMAILMLSGCATGGPKNNKSVTPEPVKDAVIQKPASAIVLEKVSYALDYDKLDEKARGVLARNIEAMLSDPSLTFNIDGHCDDRGTDRYNLDLGWRRANGVSDYLVKQGIARERLYPNSFGRAMPVVIGHDESAWSRNRRVETSIRK